MNYLGTYLGMERPRHNMSAHLYTYLLMLLTKLANLQFLHLLPTFRYIHLINTNPQLEVIGWTLDEQERNTIT